MNTKEHLDGWDDFADLLALIRNLFGDALKASEALAPKVAESASRWLRAAEAFARVLVLTLARTVVFAPTRTAGALAGQASQAGPAHAGEAPAVQRGGGRSLFAFSRSSRVREHRPRREMTQHEIEMWHYFGGKEHAAAERERRKAECAFRALPGPPASSQPTIAGWKPAVQGKRGVHLPTQTNLVRRFNALVRVFDAPDKAAKRLARRLEAAPDIAQRALATAFPRERWRSGYDDMIKSRARAAAVSLDSS